MSLQSLTQLKLTFDGLRTPMVLVDAGLKVLHVNPAFAGWLAISARRFPARSLAEITESDDRLQAIAQAAWQGSDPVFAPRIKFIDASGQSVLAMAWASLLECDPACVIIELHPVDAIAEDFPGEAIPAALQEVMRGLAHEIRNPLAGLRGAAQLLARKIADESSNKYLDVINAETNRLAELVTRLLEVSPQKPHDQINVHTALERVRILAESDAAWLASIARDYDPSLPLVQGDVDRLTQAIWNLVRNSLEAGATEIRLRTRADHHVLIGADSVKLALRIDVIDNGKGVPEDIASRIFLPMVTGRAEGSGLGLSIVQTIAREHAASLTYRSRPGHTVFSLLIPVAFEMEAEHG